MKSKTKRWEPLRIRPMPYMMIFILLRRCQIAYSISRNMLSVVTLMRVRFTTTRTFALMDIFGKAGYLTHASLTVRIRIVL